MTTSTPAHTQHTSPAFHISSIGDTSVSVHVDVSIFRSFLNSSLVPRPSEGGGEGRPGVYCMRMCQPFHKNVRKIFLTLIPTTC